MKTNPKQSGRIIITAASRATKGNGVFGAEPIGYPRLEGISRD